MVQLFIGVNFSGTADTDLKAVQVNYHHAWARFDDIAHHIPIWVGDLQVLVVVAGVV